MPSFNENLDQFLTACRETVYAELQKNPQYAGLKEKQSGLRSELEALLTPEADKKLFSYLETTSDILGMEANNIMLCGLSLSSEMRKRFDSSTPEYKAFAELYL